MIHASKTFYDALLKGEERLAHISAHYFAA